MNTFEPMEFKNWQRDRGPEPIKFVNVKPGKENMHVKIVRDALYVMYPHSNKVGLSEYDVYMEKAVKKWQQYLETPITGKITNDELVMLGKKTGKFKVV